MIWGADLFEYIQENPATVAAFLSFFATAFAAWATWKGPQTAAIIAERIRSAAERDNERRKLKFNVFSTLMQERATIASSSSVRMLNSIDFVFFDAPHVREAWAELYTIFQTQDIPHHQLREEKLRMLLKEMAKDIGLSDQLKVDDLGRIYFPNALAKEEELRLLQQEEALSKMRSRQDKNSPLLASKFPPTPPAK